MAAELKPVIGASPAITAFKRGEIDFFELLHRWDFSASTVRVKLYWRVNLDDWRLLLNQGSTSRTRFPTLVWEVLRRYGAGHYRIEVRDQNKMALMRQEVEVTGGDFENWGQQPQNPPDPIPGDSPDVADDAAPAGPAAAPPALSGDAMNRALMAMSGSYTQQAKMMEALNAAVEKMTRYQGAQGEMLLKLAERAAREPAPPQSELAATLSALIASLPALVSALGSNAKNTNGNEIAVMMRDYYERMGEFQARRHEELSAAAERRHQELLAQQREISELKLRLAETAPEVKFVESEGVRKLLEGAGEWMRAKAIPPPPPSPGPSAAPAKSAAAPEASAPDLQKEIEAFAAEVLRLARDTADVNWQGGYHYLVRRFRDRPAALEYCASRPWESLSRFLSAAAPDVTAARLEEYIRPIHAQMAADLAAAKQQQQLPEGRHDGRVEGGIGGGGASLARGDAEVHA